MIGRISDIDSSESRVFVEPTEWQRVGLGAMFKLLQYMKWRETRWRQIHANLAAAATHSTDP